MCGDSVESLSKAMMPEVPASAIDDMVQAMRGVAPSAPPPPPLAALGHTLDTIIYKATVLTMARGLFSAVEAMAVRGDTVLATGTLDEVRAAVASPTATVREFDYGDRVIMPGFIDPHVHLLMGALTTRGKQFVDMSYKNARTQETALATLSTAIQAHRASIHRDVVMAATAAETATKTATKTATEAAKTTTAAADDVVWITGFGYDPSLVENHPDLTADLLDTISDDRTAIFVMNQSGHVGYTNTTALRAMGFGRRAGEDGFPAEDKNYQKSETDGSLTGLLFEEAVMGVSKYMAKPTAAEAVARARGILQDWASRGVTTAFDCGVGVLDGMKDLALLRLVLDRRTLPSADTVLPRLHGALTVQTVEKLAPVADLLKLPPWHLTSDAVAGAAAGSVYAIKLWLDGSTQGFTAAVYEPYRDQPDNRGILNYRQGHALDAPPDDDRLLGLIQPFVRGGWQIVMHTNGGRAFDQALRVFARVLAAEAHAADSDPYGGTFGRTRPRRMHRLEHVTADISAAQLRRAAQLGLGTSHLIAHVRRWGDAFAHWVLDEERAARLDPVADAAAAGVTYSFHSDSPISEVDPLQFAETAACRVQDATGTVLGPSQCVTVEQAFAGVTYNPARQLGRLDEIGSLEPGKKADFVVLDTDPRTVDASNLVSSVTILETRIGGRIAFQAATSS